METSYDIDITAQDCMDGVRNNERLCVVATAIARLQPEAHHIEVNTSTIRFTLPNDGKNYRLVYPTPEPVKDYIRKFDSGFEATKMRFTLDNPQITEKVPKPRGAAVTRSFKAKGPAKKRRSVRVFGEKSFQAVPDAT